MSAIPESARALLTSKRLAHVCTINPDGSPQMSVVWVGLDGDEIVFGHMGHGQKIKNMERDPRVIVSVEDTEIQPPGVVVHIAVDRIGGVGPWTDG